MLPTRFRAGVSAAGKIALLAVAVQLAGLGLDGVPAVAEMGPKAPEISAVIAPKVEVPSQSRRPIAPTYSIQVGLDNEIFPVFANHASLQPQDQRTWGTVAVTIHNSSEGPIANRITVQVPGWSDQEIQMTELAAGETHTMLFAPTFLPRLFQNREIAAATVMVRVHDMGGRLVFEQSVPVRLRAADDMYWGQGFKFAPFIASWITPHDPLVEMVLSRAKEFAPSRRMPGYEDWKDQTEQERETTIQARAIYRAMQVSGISYVKSSLTFGRNLDVSERIRLPHDSLQESSANCIDGVVAFASVFENLGMDPAVVLVPGHAYVGVRVARGSDRYLYFDTALTGRANFDAAVAAAQRGLGRTNTAKVLTIRVDDARRAGILPMPMPTELAPASAYAGPENGRPVASHTRVQ